MRAEGQESLFWLCGICSHPHIDAREHRACGDALDPWYRRENLDHWANQPYRAIL